MCAVQNKRKHTRKRAVGRVWFHFPGRERVKAALVDVSQGGFCAHIPQKLEPDREIQVQLHLEAVEQPIHARAVSRWTRGEEEYLDSGLQFVDINPEDQDILNEFMLLDPD